MEYFKTHAMLAREKALLQASVRDQKKLLVENSKLKKDIEQLKNQLQEKQRRRIAKALFSTPSPTRSPAPTTQPPSTAGASAAVPTNPPPPSSSSSHDRRERQSRRKRGERKARPTCDLLSLGVEPQVDVSRLDLRVGRILGVRHHPLAEELSVQEVDVGESAARTVVSKLGEKTDLEELQGGLAVLLCNVKACKLKGVVSQARLLCCSAPDDSTELLVPPTGSTPGDRVTFLNYPGDPDRELQSKQRVWELLQPDLQVDSRGVANYKGCGFEVKGKGLCRAPSLTNCTIR
ncbi:aminoacyl tRNA synthase complex-interacting multifunctional protein 1-like [Micropterus salmoides]|uniref:aminoacyl tRNA synthase complex-interacting multifunctional protein 1-like n=1 Tax=Micropterus salmoides TaxID=27706 RepID=UPI0018EC49E2|nr:aminoacyl tRNA synthase complex-interacting multifunctional protein 1-like [Micropterus salmoides]XP_038550509.1 aminoacyl tRNA synthase complex-interacting multifunctional protein 1-like [Micropterus salmoides]